MLNVGIDRITFYIPAQAMRLSEMAQARNLASHRFQADLGQEVMALCPAYEDTITMGVNAALSLVSQGEDLQTIDWVLFATESGVDQSKAAGLYLHHFLHLSPHCRVLELKQACYSATGALQLAHALVQQNPASRVLIIASDIARYEKNSIAEPTQGCGAVAMIVADNAKILALEPKTGHFSEHVMDFWRPNYLEYALVSNSYSVKNYFDVLEKCWQHFQQQTSLHLRDIEGFCYHTPFSKMAIRVHQRFSDNHRSHISKLDAEQEMLPALVYNQQIGNAYTASLYISLCSLLDHHADLTNKRTALFSYGSGCVAEYFSGVIQPGYKNYLLTDYHKDILEKRSYVPYQTYEQLYHKMVVANGDKVNVPSAAQKGLVYFEGIQQHQRIYKVLD